MVLPRPLRSQTNRQLYHLMINSALGDERVVRTILAGIATLEN